MFYRAISQQFLKQEYSSWESRPPLLIFKLGDLLYIKVELIISNY